MVKVKYTYYITKAVAYREGGGFGVFKPPPEIPKISAESSIA